MGILQWLSSLLSSFRLLLGLETRAAVGTLQSQAAQSMTYDDWSKWQTELDWVQRRQIWFTHNPEGSYDWKLLEHNVRELEALQRSGDNLNLARQLRCHENRNVCRILAPELFSKSCIRTKDLTHSYLDQISGSIRHLTRRESTLGSRYIMSPQDKQQLFYDIKETLGKTTLLLQGGASFSLCHLGVVKALHRHRLLPRIITGTSSGALAAALVCTTASEEMERKLAGTSIDLSAFEATRLRRENGSGSSWLMSLIATARRRSTRYWKTGHAFDIDVLEQCIRDNIGDLTFQEAFNRTGRILNITVALSDVPGMPQLLNYITAPHVLVWSAVAASIATSKMMLAPVKVFCRDRNGSTFAFHAPDSVSRTARSDHTLRLDSPLKRITELFNVNHFVVVQTRPYLVPFVWMQEYRPGSFGRLLTKAGRVFCLEALHWLEVFSEWLPASLQRLLVDEAIPGEASWSKIVLTPKLSLRDIWKVFENPTASSLDAWILRGERMTWPRLCELRARCRTEFELDAAYEVVKRPAPGVISRES